MTSSPPPPPAAPWPEPDAAGLEPERPHPDVPPWPLWTLPVVVLVGFGVWILGSVIVGAVAGAGGSSLSHPSPAVSLALDFVFDVSFVAAALYVTVGRGTGRLADFGFRRVRPSLAVSSFLSAAIGYYVLTLIYASIFNLHGKDKLPSELGVNHSTAALVAATVFVCVVAPMAEELFFRGFIFGALRRMPLRVGRHDAGAWVAAVITGILFGLVHTGSASSQYLVPLGLLGFVLCLLHGAAQRQQLGRPWRQPAQLERRGDRGPHLRRPGRDRRDHRAVRGSATRRRPPLGLIYCAYE